MDFCLLEAFETLDLGPFVDFLDLPAFEAFVLALDYLENLLDLDLPVLRVFLSSSSS
jgi:hypothetical protein